MLLPPTSSVLLRTSHEKARCSRGRFLHGKVFATLFFCLCSHWWFSAALEPLLLTVVVLKILPSYINKRISLCVRLNTQYSVWQDSHINFLSQRHKYPRITLDVILAVLSRACFSLPLSPPFTSVCLSQLVDAGTCENMYSLSPSSHSFFTWIKKKKEDSFLWISHIAGDGYTYWYKWISNHFIWQV